MLVKIVIVIVVLLIAYVLYMLVNMGVFRKIENRFDGVIVKVVELPGVEDITVSDEDKFALISSTDRLEFPPTVNEVGSMYFMELSSGDFNIKELKTSIQGPFAPHGISLAKIDDGYRVLVVNGKMGEHAIEKFTLKDETLIYEETLSDPWMISPNDVLSIDDTRFYFTNDHKYTVGWRRTMEEYFALAISGVVYFDGKTYRQVANDIAFANGINIDRRRNLIYVAASRDFLVKVYSPNEDGSLNFIENIDVGTGVDNIEVGPDGVLWLGGHPNLLKLASYEKNKSKTAPSELVRVIYRGKGDYDVKSVFMDDGNNMSASTVAAPYGNFLFAGNLMDKKFLILKRAVND